MDGFMAAFNAKDAEAIRARWFHFPHVRFHSGQVTVMQTPADYRNLVWDSQGPSAEWSQSIWDYVEVIDAGPDKVHFRVQFTRVRADGSAIGSYRSLYIVTYLGGVGPSRAVRAGPSDRKPMTDADAKRTLRMILMAARSDGR
jgi:hypothetical protein